MVGAIARGGFANLVDLLECDAPGEIGMRCG